MEKALLRKEIKCILSKINIENKIKLDKKIFENFDSKFVLKGNVFIYNALPSEVSTKYIIDKYKDIVNLYMPIIENDEMFLVNVLKDTLFNKGAFNIFEPSGDKINPNDIKIDYCITPLLAYDKNLNRLGKGKGFYDRFFKVCDCLKIGLAYKCQEVEKIDADDFDIKLDYIVNEEGVIN